MIGAAISAYPWDFDRASLPRRLDRLAEIGLRRVTLAVLYHEGRQLLPGAPVHVKWVRGGVSYVPVAAARYPPGLAPDQASWGLPCEDILEAASKAGMSVDAWSVTLHRDDLVHASTAEIPAVVNAFSERDPVHLCPSSPVTEEYLLAHLADISAAGFVNVMLEGCHYPSFRHGAHHESLLLPIGERHRWLLSLCFCNACQTRLPTVDLASLQRSVAVELKKVFSGELESLGAPLELEGLAVELQALARARAEVVSNLFARLSSGTSMSLRFADQPAAAATFYTGRAAGTVPPAYYAWQYGIDYPSLAASCGAIAAPGYLADISEFRVHLQAYFDLGASPSAIHAIVRPMPPDTYSAANLCEKLDLIAGLGIPRTDFYSLSFSREADLDTLAQALLR
jgi:hypothetical protein